VLHSFRTGNRDVFTMREDGTGAMRVTSGGESDANPVWCDAGTLIIQSSTTGRDDLYRWQRPAGGGAWRASARITTGGAADPACSPDGRWIAYLRNGALHLVTPAGTDDHILVPAGDPASRPVPAMPAWTPDSRAVLYMAYDAQSQGSIWSAAVDGGAPRLLVRFDDPARPSLRRDFATDGKRLYFAIAQPESDIFFMELAPVTR
jgi:Tol biopolymer transport system component